MRLLCRDDLVIIEGNSVHLALAMSIFADYRNLKSIEIVKSQSTAEPPPLVCRTSPVPNRKPSIISVNFEALWVKIQLIFYMVEVG